MFFVIPFLRAHFGRFSRKTREILKKTIPRLAGDLPILKAAFGAVCARKTGTPPVRVEARCAPISKFGFGISAVAGYCAELGLRRNRNRLNSRNETSQSNKDGQHPTSHISKISTPAIWDSPLGAVGLPSHRVGRRPKGGGTGAPPPQCWNLGSISPKTLMHNANSLNTKGLSTSRLVRCRTRPHGLVQFHTFSHGLVRLRTHSHAAGRIGSRPVSRGRTRRGLVAKRAMILNTIVHGGRAKKHCCGHLIINAKSLMLALTFGRC